MKRQINDNKTYEGSYYQFPNEPASYGTSHISIIGPADELVSLTTYVIKFFTPSEIFYIYYMFLGQLICTLAQALLQRMM